MNTLLGTLTGLIALSLIVTPVDLQAGDRFGLKKEIEVGGTIGYQSITPVSNGRTGNAKSVFSVAPYAGFFPVDGFEIGLLSTIGIETPPTGNSLSDVRIFLAPAYNFRLADSMATPFIEGLAGLAIQRSGNNTASGFSYGGRAGVKVNVTGKGLLTFDVRYLIITEKPSNATNRYGTNELGLNAGFTVWFN